VILVPSLVSACFKDEENISLLKRDINMQLVIKFLDTLHQDKANSVDSLTLQRLGGDISEVLEYFKSHM
jgi:hypothetical protein